MKASCRRAFLTEVGRGALLASLGPSLISDLGLGQCRADEPAHRLTFGDLEPLVAMMQETPIEQFVPTILSEIRRTPIERLVAAAALANARAFGGEDYVGYHTLMALAPAYAMAGKELSTDAILAIVKVLYRNTAQIHAIGHQSFDAILPISQDSTQRRNLTPLALRDQIRNQNLVDAESALAAIADRDPKQAFLALQPAIEDDINVHRVVLVWRAWALLPITGPQHATTMLRQSVRFCVDHERSRVAKGHEEPPVRALLPKLLDAHKLHSPSLGIKIAEDAWIEQLADTIHRGTREQAAEAVASALAEGFAPNTIAEAISLAANRLVLFDPGRPERWASAGKPPGSVHGDSVGVHGSDAANAWRNIANVADPSTAAASLIVGAFHTGGQQAKSGQRITSQEELQSVQSTPPESILAETEAAIRANDQKRAATFAELYGSHQLPPKRMFDLLRQFAITQDGALHAEKYYQTVTEEFAAARPSFRWDHVVALARVTASQFGYPAPGVGEAWERLG